MAGLFLSINAQQNGYININITIIVASTLTIIIITIIIITTTIIIIIIIIIVTTQEKTFNLGGSITAFPCVWQRASEMFL